MVSSWHSAKQIKLQWSYCTESFPFPYGRAIRSAPLDCEAEGTLIHTLSYGVAECISVNTIHMMYTDVKKKKGNYTRIILPSSLTVI